MRPTTTEAFKSIDGEVYSTYEKARKANIEYYAKKLLMEREESYFDNSDSDTRTAVELLTNAVWDTPSAWKNSIREALEGLLENI